MDWIRLVAALFIVIVNDVDDYDDDKNKEGGEKKMNKTQTMLNFHSYVAAKTLL